MKLQSLARIAALTLYVVCSSDAIAQRKGDPLKPIVRCIVAKSSTVAEIDRLSQTVASRTVATPDGDLTVSLADGYRIHLRIDEVPFVNLKIEMSAPGAFEKDREIVLQQMRGFLKDQPQYASDLTIATRSDVEIVELYHREADRPSPSMITFFVAKASVIATAYVLNSADRSAAFKSVTEYEASKSKFIESLTKCLQR